MIKRLLLTGISALGLIALSSLSLPVHAQDSEELARIELAIIPQPENLDPVSVSRFDVNKQDLIENLFVGLTRIDARRGEVVPYLATDWEVSADGVTWTFNLRDDVQWMGLQDGKPIPIRRVVAQDIVFAVQRACDPRRPQPVTTNIVIIKGCRELLNRTDLWNIDQSVLDNALGVKALDETTVTFELLFPASYFLTMTTLPEFRPIPADVVGDSEVWPLANTLYTSGPWIVTVWDGQHINLIRNPTWPMDRDDNIGEIEIQFDLDANTIASRLASGTLDIARVEGNTADQVGFTNPDLVHSAAGQSLFAVGFSYESLVVSNPLVRQALSLAIDRQQLADQLSALAPPDYLPSTRFTPLTVIAATTAPGVPFDPVQARVLMEQAGYAQCANLPSRFSMAVTEDTFSTTLGQALVQQWQQNLGCADGVFELVFVSRQVLIDNAHATVDVEQFSRLPLWLVTWTADYPDANAWVADALHCQFGVLRTGRTCDNTDAVLDQAGFSFNLRDRIAGYTQAETTFFGASGSFPIIPLIIRSQQWVQQPWLSGVPTYGPFQFDHWTVIPHD